MCKGNIWSWVFPCWCPSFPALKTLGLLLQERDPICFLWTRPDVHLGVRILSLVLELICFILSSNREQIQHTTELEVYKTTTFLSASVYWVTWKTLGRIIIVVGFDALDLVLIIVQYWHRPVLELLFTIVMLSNLKNDRFLNKRNWAFKD